MEEVQIILERHEQKIMGLEREISGIREVHGKDRGRFCVFY